MEQEQPDGSWKVEGEKPSKLERTMIVVPDWIKDGGQDAVQEFDEDIDQFECSAIACKFIVKEPMHCGACDKYFCKSCLAANDVCPRCNDSSRKCTKISNFAMRHLELLEFKCCNSRPDPQSACTM